MSSFSAIGKVMYYGCSCVRVLVTDHKYEMQNIPLDRVKIDPFSTHYNILYYSDHMENIGVLGMWRRFWVYFLEIWQGIIAMIPGFNTKLTRVCLKNYCHNGVSGLLKTKMLCMEKHYQERCVSVGYNVVMCVEVQISRWKHNMCSYPNFMSSVLYFYSPCAYWEAINIVVPKTILSQLPCLVSPHYNCPIISEYYSLLLVPKKLLILCPVHPALTRSSWCIRHSILQRAVHSSHQLSQS